MHLRKAPCLLDEEFDVPTGRPTPLLGRESFMQSFLTATGDHNPKE